jgi:hypothetical protein
LRFSDINDGEVQIIDFDLALFNDDLINNNNSTKKCNLIIGSSQASCCGERIQDLIMKQKNNVFMFNNIFNHNQIEVEWEKSDDYEMLIQLCLKRVKKEFVYNNLQNKMNISNSTL